MTSSVEESEFGDPIVRSAADATTLGMAFEIEAKPGGARRFTFVGHRCLAVNGVTPEAALADIAALEDMVLPEHKEAYLATRTEAAAKMEPFDVEVAMRRADGEVRWHRIAALPRPQPDGVVLWDGLQVDVTDRREMAAALMEQQRRLEMAAEATGLGFWEWDVETESVRWSDRTRQLFGLGPDDPVDIARYLDLVHPEDREAVLASVVGARVQPTAGDYVLEHRIITPTGEVRWILTNSRMTTDENGEARLMVGTSLDISERKAIEERRSLLLGELAHRAKNAIAVIMAVVAQTARGQKTVEDFQDVLLNRLQAMAASQDLVTATGGRPVPLADVIEKAIAPFGLSRFDIDPAVAQVTLLGDTVASMGLLLHEMATNAVKYGALSNESGRVSIAVQSVEQGRAAFRWGETGGPTVTVVDREGFGTRLLKQVLRPQGGEVTFGFEPTGFYAGVEFLVVP